MYVYDMMSSSLTELVRNVQTNMPTTDIVSCLDILKQYVGNDWREYVTFSNDDTYQRNLIYEDEHFDMYVICWKGNQQSPFHDHAQYGCLFRVLQGNVTEIRKNSDVYQTTNMTTYNVGDINYINNSQGTHKIINPSNQPAVTLHIYAPSKYLTKE
jgi:predicted metal-dependent enzyme (double-stranded beta helix superfamily)